MPRTGTGDYILPLPAVLPNTTIMTTWANPTMDDIAAALTGSLARDGSGGMNAGFKLYDGTRAAPGLSFKNEPGAGLYRWASGAKVSMAIQDTDIQTWEVGGTTVPGNLSVGGTLTVNGQPITPSAGVYLPLAGGTMTGPIYMPNAPTRPANSDLQSFYPILCSEANGILAKGLSSNLAYYAVAGIYNWRAPFTSVVSGFSIGADAKGAQIYVVPPNAVAPDSVQPVVGTALSIYPNGISCGPANKNTGNAFYAGDATDGVLVARVTTSTYLVIGGSDTGAACGAWQYDRSTGDLTYKNGLYENVTNGVVRFRIGNTGYTTAFGALEVRTEGVAGYEQCLNLRNNFGNLSFTNIAFFGTAGQNAGIESYQEDANNSSLQFKTRVAGTYAERMRITKEGWISVNNGVAGVFAVRGTAPTGAQFCQLLVDYQGNSGSIYIDAAATYLRDNNQANIQLLNAAGTYFEKPFYWNKRVAQGSTSQINSGAWDWSQTTTQIQSTLAGAITISAAVKGEIKRCHVQSAVNPATLFALSGGTVQWIGGNPTTVGPGMVSFVCVEPNLIWAAWSKV
jgi:hypothetical protein